MATALADNRLSRTNNPHISRKYGGRAKPRRKSLLAVMNPRHWHGPRGSDVSIEHETEHSRTPEESTNSAEAGFSCSIDDPASEPPPPSAPPPQRTRAVHFGKFRAATSIV